MRFLPLFLTRHSGLIFSLRGVTHAARNIICKSALILRIEGARLPSWSKGHVEVAPRHSAVVNFVQPPGARPTRFHGFQSARVWQSLPRSFFSLEPSLIRILPANLRPASRAVLGLRRRSLPYPRLFNSHAWARAPFRPSSSR